MSKMGKEHQAVLDQVASAIGMAVTVDAVGLIEVTLGDKKDNEHNVNILVYRAEHPLTVIADRMAGNQ